MNSQKKKIDSSEKVRVIKASRPAAKSIDKPAPAKIKPVKSLEVKVRLQTAEGWKRGMAKSRQKKSVKTVTE